MTNKKVAIIFYGLTRTLHKTHESIKQNLFKQLEDNSIQYDIFIHTNLINGPYNNMWTGEKIENYINEDVKKILNPKFYIFDNQEEIINKINFDEYYTKLGNWTGLSETMTKYLIRNLCLALYSKKQITKIFDKHINDYDFAIIIRPDTELLNKIDVNYFNELNDNNIIIPSIDWFRGCNDRICMGKPNVISYCGKLFDQLKEYSKKKSIISERFFLDKLNEKGISIIKKNINYKQIRIRK